MSDDMTADMEANKKLSPVGTELIFISQSLFNVPKTIRLKAGYYLILEIPNKRELQQIASNHLSGIILKIL